MEIEDGKMKPYWFSNNESVHENSSKGEESDDIPEYPELRIRFWKAIVKLLFFF